MAAFQDLEGLQVFTGTYQLIQGPLTSDLQPPRASAHRSIISIMFKNKALRKRGALRISLFIHKYIYKKCVDLKDEKVLALIDSL